MSGQDEAERLWGVHPPRRGPLKWLMMYLFVMTAAGTVYDVVLSFVRPIKPDFAAGLVYLVPDRGADFYVRESEAYLLWGFAAHVAIFFIWALLIALTGAGERLPRGDQTTRK